MSNADTSGAYYFDFWIFNRTVFDQFDSFDTAANQYTIPAVGTYRTHLLMGMDTLQPGNQMHTEINDQR